MHPKKIFTGLMAWFLICTTSLCLAESRIKKMDSVASDIDKIMTQAGNYQNNSDMRENYSGVINWVHGVESVIRMMHANATKAATELGVDANKQYVRDNSKSLIDAYNDAVQALNQVNENAQKEKSTPEPFQELEDELESLKKAYRSFKESIASRAKSLKREMEEKSREWDRERSDDEDNYLKAVAELEKFIESNTKAVERGEELLDELYEASSDWESASRSGDKDQIEEAYRQYHEANEKMRTWKRAYSELNRGYAELFETHHDAWVDFVQDTKKSFEFYDGDVEEANAAYYEFMKVMYGEI